MSCIIFGLKKCILTSKLKQIMLNIDLYYGLQRSILQYKSRQGCCNMNTAQQGIFCGPSKKVAYYLHYVLCGRKLHHIVQ